MAAQRARSVHTGTAVPDVAASSRLGADLALVQCHKDLVAQLVVAVCGCADTKRLSRHNWRFAGSECADSEGATHVRGGVSRCRGSARKSGRSGVTLLAATLISDMSTALTRGKV